MAGFAPRAPRFIDIVEAVRTYQPTADFELLHRAYAFATEKHDGQKRKSGEPYIHHPLCVAKIIAEMRLDAASVCAALLHDVMEDCNVSEEEMKERFGAEIAFLVDGVTKLGRVNFTWREDQQAESFRKMLVAMARDIRVVLVKLADRLDNMRTLEHMKLESQIRIAQETMDIYAPLAGRLGINWIKSELEDLAFKYLFPEQYQELLQKTKRLQKDHERYIADVVKRLQAMLAEGGIRAHVSGRLKHLYSIYRKMRQNNVDFEQVHDVIAFRAIVDTVTQCYAALGIIHSQWIPIPGRFKDFIALPKPNMYQSLHTTVIGPNQRRIEIQIRTHEMHKIAEEGIAAHWKYKEGGSGGVDEKDLARFAWLRQLIEFQQEVSDPAEFIEAVKVDLFSDEVYAFTPKGQIKVFPRGATVIDFAYAIHTEVGHHCAGARVNGAIQPLRYQLQNGDTVEIITNPNQHPSQDWLDFVATGRARSKIRAYLRAEERKRSIKVGRELVERVFHKRNMSFARFLKSGACEKVAKALRYASADEMFAGVGFGKIEAQEVFDAAMADEKAQKELQPSFIEKAARAVASMSRTASGISIDDVDNVVIRFASCCNPLPGDPITGWVTRGRGVTIHRRDCPRAMELDPERRVEVTWSERLKTTRPVALRVITTDRPGILSNVSAAFSEAGVNIQEANCRVAPDGTAINLFHFQVDGAAKLQMLMRKIQSLDGVYSVERA
ncbi:MAG: bifunctional (p)ppGpp synthetase/guanosine-3',5'-bis(diphosphate) 3'-pyrophosphohydrolase [Sandaracinaceae bacterium]|nr:bifunctional (p)ppGpp synthetase/guanosine-3',5'-bis(diphosphate) 3'-pyrophosphohydrolase [Sandaracinaceae bacterium]